MKWRTGIRGVPWLAQVAQDHAAELALLCVSLNQSQASVCVSQPHSGNGSVSSHRSAGKSLDVVIHDVVSEALLLPSSGTECGLTRGGEEPSGTLLSHPELSH